MGEAQSGKNRILYIEDSFENRILARRILESRGYQFFEAGNAREGLKAVAAFDPDLILMDINLPDLSGFEAATRIKGMGRYRHVPIVAVTARVLKGDRERAVISGCEGYIPKPIDVDTFADTVQKYLGGAVEQLAPEEERNYLRQYTQHLIERLERQIDLTLTDELTGVGNLRYAALRLDEELSLCRRCGMPASLLFCDVDSLKRVNAEYGYDVGNAVLKKIGRILSTNRRRFDILARIQKDEFFLFLFNVDGLTARKAAERFAGQIRDAAFASGTRQIPISVSVRGGGLELRDGTLTPRSIIEMCKAGAIPGKSPGLLDTFVVASERCPDGGTGG